MSDSDHSSNQMTETSSADLVRNFSKYRALANKSPVFITHHGRRTHVMLDSAYFEELLSPDRRNVEQSQVDDVNVELMFGLAEWIDEGVIICGPDFDVQFVNRVAQAITHKPSRPLIGMPLLEAFPEIIGNLMEIHSRRTMFASEPSAADLPSPFYAGSWLRFQSFPLGDRIILKFRDITPDFHSYRLADAKETILQAMVLHGSIGYIRISNRGTIDRVDDPFCKMIDLTETRLIGIAVSDLVDLSVRPRFRQAIEQVIRGEGPVRIMTKFLSNQGTLVRAAVAIVQLHGAYGTEGAVIVLTPEDQQ